MGRSPLKEPLHLKAGRHVVRCENGPRGAKVTRVVTLRAGERHLVAGPVASPVRVILKLSQGDGVQINGQVYRKAFSISPERYRVDILRGAEKLKGAWIGFPPRTRCVLVDTPKIRCR